MVHTWHILLFRNGVRHAEQRKKNQHGHDFLSYGHYINISKPTLKQFPSAVMLPVHVTSSQKGEDTACSTDIELSLRD